MFELDSRDQASKRAHGGRAETTSKRQMRPRKLDSFPGIVNQAYSERFDPVMWTEKETSDIPNNELVLEEQFKTNAQRIIAVCHGKNIGGRNLCWGMLLVY